MIPKTIFPGFAPPASAKEVVDSAQTTEILWSTGDTIEWSTGVDILWDYNLGIKPDTTSYTKVPKTIFTGAA